MNGERQEPKGKETSNWAKEGRYKQKEEKQKERKGTECQTKKDAHTTRKKRKEM